jgi:hypothetical protein
MQRQSWKDFFSTTINMQTSHISFTQKDKIRALLQYLYYGPPKKKDHKGLRFRSYKSTNINSRQINSTQSIKFKTDKLNKAKIIKKTKTKHKSLKKLISVLQK